MIIYHSFYIYNYVYYSYFIKISLTIYIVVPICFLYVCYLYDIIAYITIV